MSGSGNYNPHGCLHPLTQTHKIYCLLAQHGSVFPLAVRSDLSSCEGVEACQRGPGVTVMPLSGTVVTSSVYLHRKHRVWEAVVMRLERAQLWARVSRYWGTWSHVHSPWGQMIAGVSQSRHPCICRGMAQFR